MYIPLVKDPGPGVLGNPHPFAQIGTPKCSRGPDKPGSQIYPGPGRAGVLVHDAEDPYTESILGPLGAKVGLKMKAPKEAPTPVTTFLSGIVAFNPLAAQESTHKLVPPALRARGASFVEDYCVL